MEELMLKHTIRFSLYLAAATALLAAPSVAQQQPLRPATEPTVQCGGQYECVEIRPITAEESKASRSHPDNVQAQDPKEIASARPIASEPNEIREGMSGP
jgi:hypothetical protein